MSLKIKIVLVIALFVSSGEALRCRTCRGNACSNAPVPEIDCNSNINKLPYNFKRGTFNTSDADHACLDLEYKDGSRVTPLRQCYLISSEVDLCYEISKALPPSARLQKCYINPGLIRSLRPSGDDDTTESPGTTESSTTDVTSTPVKQEPTTEGASAATLSLLALILSIVFHSSL